MNPLIQSVHSDIEQTHQIEIEIKQMTRGSIQQDMPIKRLLNQFYEYHSKDMSHFKITSHQPASRFKLEENTLLNR